MGSLRVTTTATNYPLMEALGLNFHSLVPSEAVVTSEHLHGVSLEFLNATETVIGSLSGSFAVKVQLNSSPTLVVYSLLGLGSRNGSRFELDCASSVTTNLKF